MRRRHLLLSLAAAGTALALYFAPPAQDPVVGAVTRSVRDTGAASAAPVPPATILASAVHLPAADSVLPLWPRSYDSEHPSRLFGMPSWETPRTVVSLPPAAQAPPPPPPRAPPTPLQLMGRYQEGGKSLLFGLFNGDSVVLEAGDNLSPEWRVDTADANQVTMLHVPTGQKQSLPWGAAP